VLDPNALPPPGSNAKTAKWLFKLLKSQDGAGWIYQSLFPDQIHDIFHWFKIFVRLQSCIFWFALRLCIIVTLEMKRITICLQWGLILSGSQKLNN